LIPVPSLLPKSFTLEAFNVNSPVLRPGHQKQLDDLAFHLKATLASAPDSFVSIIGFADAPGTEPHNLALGEQRAEAVLGYLVARGVPENVLRASSLGEQVPVVETRKLEPKNRRVEVNIHERRALTPPAPTQAPDLTYRPPRHVLTPEENLRLNEWVWKEAQPILKRERESARPGVSVSDVFGRVARELVKKMGLPEWAQDRAESLGQDVPTKAAETLFDQVTGDRNLDQNTKDAFKAVIGALMRSEVK
jgi:hypothetical protein